MRIQERKRCAFQRGLDDLQILTRISTGTSCLISILLLNRIMQQADRIAAVDLGKDDNVERVHKVVQEPFTYSKTHRLEELLPGGGWRRAAR